MEATLSARFQRSKGMPIEFADREVRPIFRVAVGPQLRCISLLSLKAQGAFKSGIHIKIRGGEIGIGEKRHTEIVLWADTCPENVDLLVTSADGCELSMWNVWQIGTLVQAWVGNAGMIVTNKGNSVLLECSNGPGEVDFSDLVVHLEFAYSVDSM